MLDSTQGESYRSVIEAVSKIIDLDDHISSDIEIDVYAVGKTTVKLALGTENFDRGRNITKGMIELIDTEIKNRLRENGIIDTNIDREFSDFKNNSNLLDAFKHLKGQLDATGDTGFERVIVVFASDFNHKTEGSGEVEIAIQEKQEFEDIFNSIKNAIKRNLLTQGSTEDNLLQQPSRLSLVAVDASNEENNIEKIDGFRKIFHVYDDIEQGNLKEKLATNLHSPFSIAEETGKRSDGSTNLKLYNHNCFSVNVDKLFIRCGYGDSVSTDLNISEKRIGGNEWAIFKNVKLPRCAGDGDSYKVRISLNDGSYSIGSTSSLPRNNTLEVAIEDNFRSIDFGRYLAASFRLIGEAPETEEYSLTLKMADNRTGFAPLPMAQIQKALDPDDRGEIFLWVKTANLNPNDIKKLTQDKPEVTLSTGPKDPEVQGSPPEVKSYLGMLATCTGVMSALIGFIRLGRIIIDMQTFSTFASLAEDFGEGLWNTLSGDLDFITGLLGVGSAYWFWKEFRYDFMLGFWPYAFLSASLIFVIGSALGLLYQSRISSRIRHTNLETYAKKLSSLETDLPTAHIKTLSRVYYYRYILAILMSVVIVIILRQWYLPANGQFIEFNISQ